MVWKYKNGRYKEGGYELSCIHQGGLKWGFRVEIRKTFLSMGGR